LFVLGTLIAFAFSEEPSAGLSQIKHMYLYLMLPVVFTAFRTPPRASLYFTAIAAVSAIIAAVGCALFGYKMQAAQESGQSFYEYYLAARISGTQRHWMAFSGKELYGLLIAAAWLFFAPLPRKLSQRVESAIGVVCATVIGVALLLS